MAETRGFGIQISKGSGSGTVLARLLEASWGGLKLEFKDTTNHGNATPIRTQRPVMGKAEPFKAKVQLGVDQLATLYGWVDPTAASDTFKFILPTATPVTISAVGWLADFGIPAIPPDGIIELELEMQITGRPEIA